MDTSKIIKGVVNSGRYTVTAPIVKEDYGIYLQIEGVELPSTYEVDFSNSEHNGTSVTMIGNSDGVLIPSQFISLGKDVFAFLYHVGADYGRTVYKFRIPNKVRPDRTNEEPTPEEQSVIDQAINALNEAVAQTAEDRENADASAQSAYESADEAQQARDRAQGYANNAQTSANNASASAQASANSATASAQSASQSAQIKTDVEELVDDAQGYANSAQQSASQASASEQGCARAVLDAASAAAIARARADEASGYAQTASAKAQDASGYAQTATQKATESAQSATNASQSATTALQAKTDAQAAQGLAEQAKADAITAKDDAESAKDEAQNLVDGISGKVEQIDANTASIESLEDDRYKPYVTDSASGSIASFSDGADNLPLKSLVVDINPIQDLSHGDPSPENICPISGWTQVNVNHSDADMTNPTTLTISLGQTVYGARIDVLSGVLRVTWRYFDGGDVTWAKIDSYNYGNFFVNTSPPSTYYTTVPSVKSSAYKSESNQSTLPSADSYVWIRSISAGIRRIYVKDTNKASMTAEEFKTAMTGVQFVYELATPIEIQLTPHEVKSLLGVNNIFADTGDCAVEYRADTKLYIERLTAPDSADMIADANITSGQYFMVGNSLYKATANIANGGQITVGTNCTRVSLAQALNEINA